MHYRDDWRGWLSVGWWEEATPLLTSWVLIDGRYQADEVLGLAA